MNIQRPLVPKFLKKWEDFLLLHKPEIWSARTHLVLYYGILFMAVLALIAYIVPNDPRENSVAPIWIGFVSIISILGLVVWLIYLLRFNVFKRYGIIKPEDRLITFLLYFIATGTIALFVLVQPYIESFRANRAYGNEEIVRDINAINTKICQIEYDSLSHEWTTDTLKVVSPGNKTVSNDINENHHIVEATAEIRPHFITIDTSELERRLSWSDSTIKISDSLYIVFHCPSYTFLQTYNSDTYSREKELDNVGIYKTVIRNYRPVDKDMLRSQLNLLITKYVLPSTETEDSYTSFKTSKEYSQIIREKYKVTDVSSSINNITERKYRWAPDKLADIFRILYYITLTLSLLIFIFRHSTTKTFFLSLLTIIILTILTALLMAFAGYKESSFFAWLLTYSILFFIISLLVWKNKTRNVITGIGINLFVLLTPVVPLIVVAFYYALLRDRNTRYDIEPYDREVMHQHLYYAEIAGALLLLILLITYIQAVYRKWYALPQE